MQKPRINRQDRQKITLPGSVLPQGDIPAVHSRYTHTEAVHCQRVLMGSSITECSRIYLGEGRQTSRQPTDASTPATEVGNVSHRAGEEHKYHAIK